MDFTPTNPADLEIHTAIFATARAAFDERAAKYQRGIEAIKQEAASKQDTDAGVNLYLLGIAMKKTPFDESQASGIAANYTSPKEPQHGQRGSALSSDSGPSQELIEMASQDAIDMEIVAPIQFEFTEKLYELAGQLSMRQMMTLSQFLYKLTTKLLGEFERIGCDSVGDFEMTPYRREGGLAYQNSQTSEEETNEEEEDTTNDEDTNEDEEETSGENPETWV